MTSAPAFSSGSVRFSTCWIIDRRSDLIWFIAGSLAGYLLFYLHAGLKLDMLVVWFLWVTLLDTPHFFGTYSRTYLDKVEWQRRRTLLVGSLGWFLLGPIVIAASGLLYRAGFAGYRLPLIALVVFVSTWAYLHVVRQHFGIMRLYARKNGDLQPVDLRIDWLLLHVGLFAPLAAFALLHPEVRTMLRLPARGAGWAGLMHWEQAVIAASAAAVAAVTAIFAGRQVGRIRRGLPLNLPKILFLAAVVPFYVFVCYSPASGTAPLLAFVAFVTLSHDFQYHALVWFHHRNRYRTPGADAVGFGLAQRLSRNVMTFFGCALAMSVVLRFLGCFLELTPGCSPLVLTSRWNLFGDITSRELLIGVMVGFQMHHYFLDQYIWRPSQDAGLARDLDLPPA